METRDLQALPAPDPHPIPESFWVVPGRFLAGQFPSAREESEARQKLGRLLGVGVNFILDLTEEGESGLEPYARFLPQGVLHRRLPIPDLAVPARERLVEILDTLDAALRADRVVYLHCFGGIGRTGTVVGSYLVRHGATGSQALERIAAMRVGTPGEQVPAPETAEQRRLVLTWFEERRRPAATEYPQPDHPR